MDRAISVLLFLILIPAAFVCAEYKLEYVYGSVEMRAGGAWQSTEPGTMIAPDSMLRIGSGSVAELTSGNLRIMLSEPGVYSVAELTQSSHRVSSWGIVQTVRGKIRNLFRGQPEIESTAMGVRAEEVGDDLGFDWMDEEEDAVDQGKGLLAEERYLEAVEYFEEALELADEHNRGLYQFYIAYAYAMEGRYGPAMRYLSQSDPSPLMVHYPDHVLLKGQLLVQSRAYQEALDLFDSFLRQDPDHENLQEVHFLSAFCHHQLGRTGEAERMLRQACQLDPSSQTGRQAKSMLDSL